ncbi:MAG: hypothetical protein U0W24_12650 [Bacteroidales bacterium]
MNSLLNMCKTIMVLALVAALASCNGKGGNDENLNDSLVGLQDIQSQTYYLIPSPEGLFNFIKDGKLKFSDQVLNPTNNIDNYIDTRSKELNFGIYSADLAYVASFNKYQQSVDYLNTVRTLSDEIGISAVFDQNLIGRIDNIIDDQDSLLKVTSDSYHSIVRYLESSDRKKSLALIVTGGWVESIYVVVNLLDNYKQDAKVINLLASQKHIVENLISYLDQLKNEEAIKQTINELKPLADFYAGLEVQKVESQKNETKTGDKIEVGGNTKIIMTETQFLELKKLITSIRNNMTKKG